MCGQCDERERQDNEEFEAGALRQEAVDFLASLPRKVRTCEQVYSLALVRWRTGSRLGGLRAS